VLLETTKYDSHTELMAALLRRDHIHSMQAIFGKRPTCTPGFQVADCLQNKYVFPPTLESAECSLKLDDCTVKIARPRSRKANPVWPQSVRPRYIMRLTAAPAPTVATAGRVLQPNPCQVGGKHQTWKSSGSRLPGRPWPLGSESCAGDQFRLFTIPSSNPPHLILTSRHVLGTCPAHLCAECCCSSSSRRPNTLGHASEAVETSEAKSLSRQAPPTMSDSQTR